MIKNWNKVLSKYLIPVLAVISTSIFLLMYFNLEATVDEYASTLLKDKANESKLELDKFFEPIISNLSITQLRGTNGDFKEFQISDYNQHFIASTEIIKPLSSLMLANEFGDELMILTKDGEIQNRVTYKSSEQLYPQRFVWKQEGVKLVLKEHFFDTIGYNPKSRPWYALVKNAKPKEVHWTSPYKFYTTKELGVTLATTYYSSTGSKHFIAYDILLSDISEFTSNFDVYKNGFILISSSDGQVIGLPSNSGFDSKEKKDAYALATKKELNIPTLNDGIAALEESDLNSKGCFSYKSGGKRWWGYRMPYELGNQIYYIEVYALERDFLSHVRTTQYTIIFVFILGMFVLFFIARSLNKRNKLNHLINKQKQEVENKNREILDSIHYAKRIQSAILPPAKIVSSYLANSFIYYLPKDIVAGDFYWMEKVGDQIIFAAADCTGHGVPGALMSVLCNNALNRSVREFGLTDPGKILDKTREIVIEEFEKSEEEVSDGMDIALITLEGDEVSFAGANNPLWIINTNKELTVIKGDRQPIGNYSTFKPYKTHKLKLNQGDTFYIFTDGFQDQFGGELGKKMKISGLKQILLSIQELSMDAQKDTLASHFEEWRGSEEQIDDVCFIGVRIGDI